MRQINGLFSFSGSRSLYLEFDVGTRPNICSLSFHPPVIRKISYNRIQFHNAFCIRLYNNSQSSRKLSRLNLFSYTEIISLNDMLYKVLITNILIKTVSFVLNCIARHCTDGLALPFLPSPYRLNLLQFAVSRKSSSFSLRSYSIPIQP